MNKIKRLSVCLSVLLGSILITPMVVMGVTAIAPSTSEVMKSTNAVNSGASIPEPSDLEFWDSDKSGWTVHVLIHQNKIAPNIISTVPPVGQHWDNSSNKYGSLTCTTGQTLTSAYFYTMAIDKAKNQVRFAFDVQSAGGHHIIDSVWVDLSNPTVTPTYSDKGEIYKILPSKISAKDFSTYINLIDPHHYISGNTSWKSNDTDGTLELSGHYRASDYNYADKLIMPFTQTLTGFAKPEGKPTFSANGNAPNILPSSVGPSNYTQYLTIGNKGNIKNVTKFSGDNSTGTLKFTVNYYTTTYHGGEPTASFPVTITNFAKDNGTPTVITKTSAKDILPSKVSKDNYSTYLSVSNPTAIKDAESTAHDDSKGTLSMKMVYYSTSSHSSSSPTGTKTYNFNSGFANLTAPVISINQSEINDITEADFNEKIIFNDPTKTLDNIQDYVTISNIDPSEIISVNYSNNNLEVAYCSTTYVGSPTYKMNQKMDGFHAPGLGAGGIGYSNTIIIICMSIIAILALGGLGYWYYRRSKGTTIQVRGSDKRQNLRLEQRNAMHNSSRMNSRVQLGQRNPNGRIQGIRPGSYPTTYSQHPQGRYPLQVSQGQRSSGRYPTQSRGQQAPGRYPMQVTQGQRPSGRYPAQSRGHQASGRYPTQSRGQQASGRYPTQSKGQQTSGRYPTQTSGGNPRTNRPSGRNNPPNGSSRPSGKNHK